jgi:hypothetical protein
LDYNLKYTDFVFSTIITDNMLDYKDNKTIGDWGGAGIS